MSAQDRPKESIRPFVYERLAMSSRPGLDGVPEFKEVLTAEELELCRQAMRQTMDCYCHECAAYYRWRFQVLFNTQEWLDEPAQAYNEFCTSQTHY